MRSVGVHFSRYNALFSLLIAENRSSGFLCRVIRRSTTRYAKNVCEIESTLVTGLVQR